LVNSFGLIIRDRQSSLGQEWVEMAMNDDLDKLKRITGDERINGFIALFAVVVITIIKVSSDYYICYSPPLLLYVFAVMIAAACGGFRTGVVATAFSILVCAVFFVPPLGNPSVDSAHNRFRLTVFGVHGILVSGLIGALHAARRRAERLNDELTVAYDGTIEAWSRVMDLRDKETEGHSRRVTEMTLRVARSMGIEEAELVHVRRGALLHDIGKMGIPDAILLKPGPLTADEWVIMRSHPQLAREWLSPISFLRPAMDIPYGHHEKWDGTGYPLGLKGEQIPLAVRIFAAVDIWDALRSDRPYRAAWSLEMVIGHIRSLAGTHLDPSVLEVFLGILESDGAVVGRTTHERTHVTGKFRRDAPVGPQSCSPRRLLLRRLQRCRANEL
jgi:putative nucleotidyltransferase with HDIG domain